MTKASVYVGTSLDGFIARPDHRLDFLESAGPIEGDMGFGAFLESVDVLVMGRNTYDVVIAMMADDGTDWPYDDLPVVVVTNRPLEVPEALTGAVGVTSLEPGALMEDLASQGFQHAYVDGGQTIQRFLRGGFIDELTITVVPVLIGAGVPLFGAIPADIVLHHVETITFGNGCVQSRYVVD